MALVERGGSLWLNCSTNCPRPERGGLETSLRRNGTQRGLRWLARQLVDIREPETQPVCFFRCARRTLQARGLIRTFREYWVDTPLGSLDLPLKLRPPVLGSSFPRLVLRALQLAKAQVLVTCRATGSGRACAAPSLAASGRELHLELQGPGSRTPSEPHIDSAAGRPGADSPQFRRRATPSAGCDSHRHGPGTQGGPQGQFLMPRRA